MKSLVSIVFVSALFLVSFVVNAQTSSFGPVPESFEDVDQGQSDYLLAGTCASPTHDADCSLCNTKALCVSCCATRHPGTTAQDKIDRDNCEAAASCSTIKRPTSTNGSAGGISM